MLKFPVIARHETVRRCGDLSGVSSLLIARDCLKLKRKAYFYLHALLRLAVEIDFAFQDIKLCFY